MSDETDYKTIRIPKDAFTTAKQRKNSNNQTWGEYLTDTNRGHPDPSAVATSLTAELNLDASDAKDELETIKELVNDTESDVEELKNELSMANDPGVEIDAEQIINRLDDLEAQLPKRVAEELRQ